LKAPAADFGGDCRFLEPAMYPLSRLVFPLAATLAACSSPVLSAELLTIEQAQARSKETGRPILAMGGSKT
jgi:hypothetical protein